MEENLNSLNSLLERLDNLQKRQQAFSTEIAHLKADINSLKRLNIKTADQKKEPVKSDPVQGTISKSQEPVAPIMQSPARQSVSIKKPAEDSSSDQERKRIEFEKFIGENLINKIGIVITIIGVAIGTKYAIDHQLISPLARIVSGYLFGLGLLVIAIRLKKSYDNFSAVLLSGSMAIMYFITYAAYTFYKLFPQPAAFSLMVIFTAYAVIAAMSYNRQVIAHIGLVGAYAVPFLLSEGSDNVTVLFAYTAIINIGILIISFRKYWKPLWYSSFLITWLMYLVWFLNDYKASDHFGTASVFITVFFVTFYMMFLAYKLLQKEKFNAWDVILLLANSFIFYGAGLVILSDHFTGKNTSGIFTAFNAIVHAIITLVVYRRKLADRNLFYLVLGLAIIFLTIAVPVQLNGSWVTLLWIGEAVVLFLIGRTRQVKFYETISYIMIFLALMSLLQDWSSAQIHPGAAHEEVRPFINAGFLTSLLFTAASGFICYLDSNKAYRSPYYDQEEVKKLISLSFSTILLIVLYFSFQIEISAFWTNLYNKSFLEIPVAGQDSPRQVWNTSILHMKDMWLLNYTCLFFFVFSVINIKKVKNVAWGNINLIINVVLILFFLIAGLYILSELREDYLNRNPPDYERSIMSIWIRYISIGFVALVLASLKMYSAEPFMKVNTINLRKGFDVVFYIALIWILSSELLSWMDIMHYTQAYKLALSILWGVYALGLIILGIWHVKQHLRVIAIALFAVTLLKLFFYDLSHLNTVSKTIVFITLGILLLIISFLYNKYRNVITGEIK